MSLTWTCEIPEPGRHATPAPWYTEFGPVRLEVAEDADGAWMKSSVAWGFIREALAAYHGWLERAGA